MTIYSSSLNSSNARLIVAIGTTTACASAHAHGDFGPLIAFIGFAALVVLVSLVTAIAMLVNHAARKRRIAQGLPPISDQATERTPFWYWVVLLILCLNLIVGIGSLVSFASLLSRSVSFAKPFAYGLMVVLQVGLSLTAVIGVSLFRKWGWWAGIALFSWATLGLISRIIAAVASDSDLALSRLLVFSSSAFLPVALGLLLLPSARERFFGIAQSQKPVTKSPLPPAPVVNDNAKPARNEQPSHVEATPSSSRAKLARDGDNAWADTIPGLMPKFTPDPSESNLSAIPLQPEKRGLPAAERWLGVSVITACVLYTLWIFAWPWLRANVLSEYEKRAAIQQREKAVELYSPRVVSDKPAEKVAPKAVSQASEPRVLFQPIGMGLRPLTQDDYALIERYPSPGIPEPGKPHCRIGLYADSTPEALPIVTIWRSKNGAHFLIYLNDGNVTWIGQTAQSDLGQLPARLGGLNPSLPFSVKFKLSESGQTTEKRDQQEIDIQVISKPVFEQNGQRAKFNIKTSMQRYTSMQAREDCAYPAALAYLSLSPELYSVGR